ncbi:protein spire [Elysia marginata]|uniref:Protein spire n=1 Tax=Elysia marginata TaxID=1093978 RepID=A0AAV4EUL7_9GAST|nr:protein spire [Elysia marginata]
MYGVPPNTPTDFMLQFMASCERHGLLKGSELRGWRATSHHWDQDKGSKLNSWRATSHHWDQGKGSEPPSWRATSNHWDQDKGFELPGWRATSNHWDQDKGSELPGWRATSNHWDSSDLGEVQSKRRWSQPIRVPWKRGRKSSYDAPDIALPWMSQSWRVPQMLNPSDVVIRCGGPQPQRLLGIQEETTDEVDERKLKPKPPSPPDPHELLLNEIRSRPKLRPVRDGKLVVEKSAQLSNASDASLGGKREDPGACQELCPPPVKRVIKPDFNLLLNNSFEVSKSHTGLV